MFVQVNTFQAIRDYYFDELTSIYSQNEVQLFFEITSEHFLGWNKTEQRLKLDARLSESELLNFHFTLKRLRQKEPIQYILEEAPFYGMSLKVTPATLIPRPETEELVALVLKHAAPTNTILDIGTGSGCIPLALKKAESELMVFATDVSEEALQVGAFNAKQLGLSITFEHHDILSDKSFPDGFPEKFDIIVSNPPYVRATEKEGMEDSVLNHEPHLALFVENENPLIFYRAIGIKAQKALKEDGLLFFEINQYLAKETKEMLEALGFIEVSLVKDINNNFRMIHAKK